MAFAPPRHRPAGWRPYQKPADPTHARYHTTDWEKTRRLVLERDGHACVLCGHKGGRLHVDHIVEVKDGGTDDPANLRTLCPACDNRRHADKGRAPRR